MSNVGFRIFSEIKRPDKELVEQFRDLDVSNIADTMGQLPCLDSDIKPYNKAKLLGTAFTVKLHEGDNLMIHKAMDMAQEGDIIVVDGGGQTKRAFIGEIMANYANMRKLGGFLIDGAIRDVDSIREMDFPVYAKGVNPNGPQKNGPGEINVPVTVGGQTIMPGDIVVGDADGVVVINPQDASKLVNEVRKLAENEEKTLSNIEKGIGMDRAWIDKALEEKGCEIY